MKSCPFGDERISSSQKHASLSFWTSAKPCFITREFRAADCFFHFVPRIFFKNRINLYKVLKGVKGVKEVKGVKGVKEVKEVKGVKGVKK